MVVKRPRSDCCAFKTYRSSKSVGLKEMTSSVGNEGISRFDIGFDIVYYVIGSFLTVRYLPLTCCYGHV